jgi:hypothetical protein
MSSRRWFVAGCIAVLACNGSTSPAESCNGTIQVTVQPDGANPTFDWAPACGISRVTVTRVSAQPDDPLTIVWAFTVPESSPIAPTIRYGTAPSGATITVQPKALAVGVQYRVEVSQTLGGDVLTASGNTVFTR